MAPSLQIIGTGNNGKTPSSLQASTLQNSTGNAGEVNITTNRMVVQDGAFVGANTFGEGNGGNLIINAEDLQIIGFGGENPRTNQPYPSGIYASADEGSTGNAGDLTINTKRMLVEAGAQLAAGTFSQGDAGNLTIDASDVVELIGRGESNEFATGLFARSLENSTGDGGNLTVNTKQMLIKDQAQVSVESLGTGNAGNLNLTADSITLNQGNLTAESVTGKGGDINLDINQLLLLRNNTRRQGNKGTKGTNSIRNPKSKIQNRIVEATGWIVDQNCDIFFVAEAAHGTPSSFNNASCLKK